MSKTIVITGASDGIGKAAAKKLVADHHEILLVGRDPAKTRAAARDLGVACYIADFAKLDDVRRLADALHDIPQIDVLANNAGGIQAKREITVDGYERTLQINHLAPFLLTNLLLPQLLAANASVINTASVANLRGHVNMADLNMTHGYRNFKAYGTTKLMNILFTYELNHRYQHQGLRTAAFHPGVIASNFGAGGGLFVRTAYHTPLRRLLGFKTVDEGAAPLITLAANDSGQLWHTGNYYDPDLSNGRTNHQAHDIDLAHDLWEKSAEMVGLT